MFIEEKMSPGLWLNGLFNSEINEEAIRALLDHDSLHVLMNRLLKGLDALAESFSWAKNYFSENKTEDTKFSEPYYVPVFALHPSKEYYIPLRIDSTILGLNEIVKTPEEPDIVPVSLKGIKRISEDEKEQSTGETTTSEKTKKTKLNNEDVGEKTIKKENPISLDEKLNVKINGDESLFPINIMVNLALNRTISLTSLFLTLHDWFANELDRVSRKKANIPPKEASAKQTTEVSMKGGEINSKRNETEKINPESTNSASNSTETEKKTESAWLTEIRNRNSKKPKTPEIDLSTANWKTLSDLAKAAVLINHEMTNGESPPKLETATKMLSMIASAASVLDIEFINKINKEQEVFGGETAAKKQVQSNCANENLNGVLSDTSSNVNHPDVVASNLVSMRATLPSPPLSLPFHHQALVQGIKEESNATNQFNSATNNLISILPGFPSRTHSITNGLPTFPRPFGAPSMPLLHASTAVCTSPVCPSSNCGPISSASLDRQSQLINRSVAPGALYPFNLLASNDLIARSMSNSGSDMFSPSSGSASSRAHSPLAHSRGHSPGQSLGHSPGQARGLSPAHSHPPFTSPGLQHHFASQLYQKWPGAPTTAATTAGQLTTSSINLATHQLSRFSNLELGANNSLVNGFGSQPNVSTSATNGSTNSLPLWSSNPLMMSLFGNGSGGQASESSEASAQQQALPELYKDQVERFHYMMDNVGELAAAAAAQGRLPGMPQLYPPTSTSNESSVNINALLNRRPDSRAMGSLSSGRPIQTSDRFMTTPNRLTSTTPGHLISHDRLMSTPNRLLTTPGQSVLSPGAIVSNSEASNERLRLPSLSNTPINLSKESNKLITQT